MSKLFQTASVAAIAALMATAPVFAQEATDDGAAPEMAAPDAADSTDMDAGIATDPAVSAEATDPAAPAEVAVEDPPKPVEGQIVLQSEDTILAKNLMGTTVYTTSGDETVGSISDLIINLDGSVDGVVIGVGGFLGIGKKLVAVEMSTLNVAIDEAGSARLTTAATKADLEAAETFVTAKEQENAAAAEQMDSGLGDTGVGTVPAE